MNDLEVWLLGGRNQIEIAIRALGTSCTILYVSEPETLGGEDRGRVRRYVRAVPAGRRSDIPEPEMTPDDPPLFEE